MKTIDKDDPDSDGFSNGAEFTADTLPGDANSKPTGTPDVTKTDSTTTKSEAAPGPFDPKNLLMPKHAQHPVVVHFPIALFMASLFFDILGSRKKNKTLSDVGRYNLIAAAVTALGGVATGLLAWQSAYGGATLQGPLLWHLCLAILTTLLLFSLWGIRLKREKEAEGPWAKLYPLLAGITFVVVAITGHLGGYLVFGS